MYLYSQHICVQIIYEWKDYEVEEQKLAKYREMILDFPCLETQTLKIFITSEIAAPHVWH